MISNIDEILSLEERDYYSNFAYIMKNALFTNSGYYSFLVKNMYEIFDKDKDTWTEILVRNKKNKSDINVDDVFTLSLYEYFKGEMTMGECTSLGLIACAFISYKLNVLAMEEYYELRDMFVPFNLPISISVKNIQDIFDIIKGKEQNIIVFDRIGKARIYEEKVTDELIVLALDELNFSEED